MIKEISEGKNHKAIDIGSFDQLSEYSFIHPKFGTEDKSRLFTGELLKSTGAEISFRELAPDTTVPFLHGHHQHEEIYIFIKGKGKYQVDNHIFEIKEGSMVRVSPRGSRTLSNTSDKGMIYMVVQSRTGSLAGYNISDGYRIDGEVKV